MKKQKVLTIKEQNKKHILLKLGNEIRNAREKKHISQVKLSHELYDYGFSVSVDSIISYELGRVNIPSAALFIIAAILDMDLIVVRKNLLEELKKTDM